MVGEGLPILIGAIAFARVIFKVLSSLLDLRLVVARLRFLLLLLDLGSGFAC